MELEEFIGRNVNPGEPLTADAWNGLVEGLRQVNDHVRTAVSTTLKVIIGNTVIDADRLRVIASSEDGQQIFEAVRKPGGEVLEYQFSAIPAGVYTVRAQAPGFAVGSQAVRLPEVTDVQLTLQPAGALMPDLFGVGLLDGLKVLADLSIEVSRVIDITGRDLVPAKPGSDYEDSPILMQTPAPGEAVSLDDSAQLAVAVALRQQASVEVPSLAGLTLSEARQALESLGLVLGQVVTRKS